MRVVLQRVNHAAVRIDGETVGQIQKGYLLLVGLAPEDTDEQLDWMVHKIVNLRVFEDGNGKLNRALADVNGEILSISQFTLYADVKHGNRPGFSSPVFERSNIPPKPPRAPMTPARSVRATCFLIRSTTS